MRRRSHQRPRPSRRAVLGACMVLGAAALAQASEDHRSAKAEADEAAPPPSAEARQTVATAGNVELPPALGDNRRTTPTSPRPARSPTDTRTVVAALPRAAITLSDAAAIVRQSYGGNVVHGTEAPQPADEGAEGARYRIRVDVDGRVKTVFVDPAGRILKPPPRQEARGKREGLETGALSRGRSPASGARGAGPSHEGALSRGRSRASGARGASPSHANSASAGR